MVNFANTGRRWIMINPFDGRGDARYNTDLSVAQDGWNSAKPTTWVRLPLVPAVENADLLREWGPLAFLHLDTPDFNSELASPGALTSQVILEGIAIIDGYGWESLTRQQELDAEIERLGLLSFELPTLQLVVMKPIAS